MSTRARLAAVPPEQRALLIRRIIGLFAPHRRKIALLFLVIAVQAVSGVAAPFFVQDIIDRALPERSIPIVTFDALGMIAGTAVGSVFSVAMAWQSNRIGQQVMHDLRVAVYSHLQRMSFGFFTRTRTGDVQSRIANDIGGVDAIITNTLASAIQGVIRILAIAIAIIVLDWKLAIFALIILPVYLAFTYGLGRKRRAIVQSRQLRMANLASLVQESLSVAGVLLAKTMGRQQELRARFVAESQEIANNEVQAATVGRWRLASRGTIMTVVPAIVYWIAGMTAAQGMSVVSIGTVVAAVSLLNRTVSPAAALQGLGLNVSTSIAIFARIFDVLDLPVDISDQAGATELTVRSGTVRLEDVSFCYDDSTEAAIRHLSLTIPAGTTTAIVGHTGSGKTTLAYLVARLYEPTSGAVLIDDTDLRSVTLDSLARAVGFVSQETYLFHASIADNLRFANPDADDADLELAARAARIHQHITTLPRGYDTVVGERGYRFSGGERQRIAIARLLLRDPSIVILDEATSALDNETERAVQDALDELSRNRTTIAIAHRLSTIRNADQVVVLDHGVIVERGTPQQLLTLGGHFATLANPTRTSSDR
jgi:ATP-binding cassette subfamily B protein